GGTVVYGAVEFRVHDDKPPPPPMPDWSPVRSFGGYGRWADTEGAPLQATLRQHAAACGCANGCNIHGHAHANAWTRNLPIDDLKGFWGALGCACWAA
ncbi:MAG: amidohydrolase, partial [Rhodoferax sp.]|nr:amidohydrolase [Rhodoferax sp.]